MQSINLQLSFYLAVKEHHIKEDFEEFKFKPPPIGGNVEERCQNALEHVSCGIECLKYFPTDSEDQKHSSKNKEDDEEKMDKGKTYYEEETVNMAKPFQAIPMPYEPLHPATPPDTTTNKATTINAGADNSPR